MTITTSDILICLKISGFASIESLADQFAVGKFEASLMVDAMVADGQVKHVPAGIKLRTRGHADAQTVWEAERCHADAVALAEISRRFAVLDSSFTKAISDWRMRKTPDGLVRNDHDDTMYDARLIGHVQETHLDVLPIAIALGRQVERCASYSVRLEQALAKLEAGDTRFMSDSVVQSYDTVWLELREDIRFLSCSR